MPGAGLEGCGVLCVIKRWFETDQPTTRWVNMHKVKTHLTRLVEEVAAEAPFLICKAGLPMVRVTALEDGNSSAAPRRRLRMLAGLCQVPDVFDQMAAAEIADLFEAR